MNRACFLPETNSYEHLFIRVTIHPIKSDLKIFTILLALIIATVLFTKQASAQQANVSFQVFYDQLSPYGKWIDFPRYGYAWIPNAGADFAPYSTRGHWLLTDYGWTWVSDYAWGWAPFHYGRWAYDNFYGWLWVPANEWGPSWVTWRRANGYYGWTPMEPGISISVSFGRAYNKGNDHWIFVRDRDIDRPDIHRYYVNRMEHDRIIRNSTVINKTYVDNRRHTTYVTGPAREDVQRLTGRRVSPAIIRDNNKPGQNLSNGQLRIYRPVVDPNKEKGHKPAPSIISNPKEGKRPLGRDASNQSGNMKIQDNHNKVQPSQSQKTSPANNRGNQRWNIVQPQHNPKQAQPLPIKPDYNRKEQQHKASTPTNTNIRTESSQPQKTNPANNNRNQRQNRTQPQSNDKKAQPSQPRKVNQQDNSKRNPQSNNVKTSNNNRTQHSKEPQSEQHKKQKE